MPTYCPASDSPSITGRRQTTEHPSRNADKVMESFAAAPTLRAVLRTSSYARAWLPPHLLESLPDLA